MTLTDLLTELHQQGAIPPSRLKDLKTSVRYLAHALGANGPAAVLDAERLAGAYKRPLDTYFRALESPVSPHTVRNTLNNLSFLYRQARAHGLIPAYTPRPERMPIDLARRRAQERSPYRHRLSQKLRGPHYNCPVTEWPPDLRERWERYCASRRLEVKPITIQTYTKVLGLLIGYALHIEGQPVSGWDDLFDTARVIRFIHWHTNRARAPRITRVSREVALTLKMLAKHEHRPEHAAWQHLTSKLPKPEPMHNKQDPEHTVQLKELEDVGLTLRDEARALRRHYSPNKRHHYPGLRAAVRHQIGLILRLLVRIPLRQRNIREMHLGQNLFQDDQQVWHLRFQGQELKIAQRGGRTNVFYVPFPPDLVEHLEEFLQQYRPLIPHADQTPLVFLTKSGLPYSQTNLSQVITDHVLQRLGKRFYPHLIRTIYTDACLLQTHDISTVAFMLNDRPETVLARYHELRANDHIQKAYQFSQSLLGT